ncbi:MAG: DUF424 family protein [Candidatus Micrarchaeota archaeon]
MYLNIHQTKMGRIIAVCDQDLIDKVFKEGEKLIDLKSHKSFYVGKKATKEDVKRELEIGFGSVNFVGSKATKLLLELEFVSKEDILHIADVPYTQIYNM